jgi:hypothetical protein
MIVTTANPRVGDPVQLTLGSVEIPGRLADPAGPHGLMLIEAAGTRFMAQPKDVWLLTDRLVQVWDRPLDPPLWEGPIERATERLQPGSLVEATSDNDTGPHLGWLVITLEGLPIWTCSSGCEGQHA